MLEPWTEIGGSPCGPSFVGPDEPLTSRGARMRLKVLLFNRQGGRCAYCDRPMRLGNGPEPVIQMCTLERIIPGADYTVRNCVAACHQCNRLRGNLSTAEIRRMLVQIERLMEERDLGQAEKTPPLA